MNRGSLRGFASGILIATVLVGGLYYIEESDDKPLTLEELTTESEKLGYVLVKKEEASTPKTPMADASVEKEEIPPEKSSTSYQLHVSSGMNSEDIADLLHSNGVIDDARSFQNYLNDQELTTNIQIGSYVLTKAMTYEQIAGTITN